MEFALRRRGSALRGRCFAGVFVLVVAGGLLRVAVRKVSAVLPA
jgi:hypothetical protein